MELKQQNITPSLDENIINLRTVMSNSSDLTIKYAKIGGHRICIVFCEGMTSTDTMAELIFQPLNTLTAEMPFESFVRTIEDGLIIAGEQKQADTYSDICENIMSGFVAIWLTDWITQ